MENATKPLVFFKFKLFIQIKTRIDVIAAGYHKQITTVLVEKWDSQSTESDYLCLSSIWGKFHPPHEPNLK